LVRFGHMLLLHLGGRKQSGSAHDAIQTDDMSGVTTLSKSAPELT
jgi:hypothetical protein